jgi:hypothetical protein
METKDRYILFPVGFTTTDPINEDNVNDVGLYHVVDTATDFIVAEVGMTVPADDRYGYDPLWAWRTADGRNASSPFRDPSDALDNFIAEVEE